jgi:hypothetical protein
MRENCHLFFFTKLQQYRNKLENKRNFVFLSFILQGIIDLSKIAVY